MSSLPPRIYLASKSSRRRELLRQIGVSFEMLLSREGSNRDVDINEEPLTGEDPLVYVRRVAEMKATLGWHRLDQRRLPRNIVLAADTTISLDGGIIGKPASKGHAAEILGMLSGKTHQVLTAVTLRFETRIDTRVSVSEVTFRQLTEAEIRHYISTGEPMDKAGAYAIQGRGAIFITRLAGSYSGVMGLPLAETAQLLRDFGHPVF